MYVQISVGIITFYEPRELIPSFIVIVLSYSIRPGKTKQKPTTYSKHTPRSVNSLLLNLK